MNIYLTEVSLFSLVQSFKIATGFEPITIPRLEVCAFDFDFLLLVHRCYRSALKRSD